MSSIPICTAQDPGTSERRAHPRRRLDQLAYVGFGPDCGGVLLDISVGGLRCQIVGPVVEGDRCHLKFALPGRRSAIETDGQVVWSNKSKQGGGVRLLGLGEDVRQQLQKWIGGNIPSARVSAPIPIPIRTKTVAAVHVLPNRSDAETVVPARDTSVRKLPVSPPGPRQPRVHLASQPKRPLAIPPSQPRNLRAAALGAVAACIILGLAALALSNFNLARLADPVKAESLSGVVPAPTATTAAQAADLSAASSQTGLRDENPTPRRSSDAPGNASPVSSQPARPEVPISNSVPAPSDRLVQRPPAAATGNRRSLAMAQPRPRLTSPKPPPTAFPEPATAEIAQPPVALMDLQSFAARLPEPPQPVRPPTGTIYQQPELITRVEPTYSRYARDARLQGTVQISATIGADGVPRSLARDSGNAALADMAMEAVRQWRYQPALLNGQPTEAHTVTNFTFQLR